MISDMTATSKPLASSPVPAVFSDDNAPVSSPPSSPPGFPWESAAVDQGKAVQPQATSAFSVLGKRKALDAISENARPTKRVASANATSTPLTQMQISIGQEVQKICKTCGMEYVPSSAEDRKLHDKYHKQNSEGYDVGKDFVSKTRPGLAFAGAKKGDSICAVDCFDSHHRKRRAQAALEIVQRELGAVDIPKEKIWDVKHCEEDWLLSFEPTHRAYLYVRGVKCIGFLLVKKIKEAYSVVEPASSTRDHDQTCSGLQKKATGALATLKARDETKQEQLKQPIQLSTQSSPALLGVSRIWTSPTHRHQNIASTLLDAALKDYNERAKRNNKDKANIASGVDPDIIADSLRMINDKRPNMEKAESKDMVAFSQPTEAGTRLARRWFGRNWGWSVYVE